MIIRQELVFTGNENQKVYKSVQKQDSVNRANSVHNDKEEIKKVAKEMESLFAYQLLKIMRQTTENISDHKEENGQDTYMSMFDMEVSKLLADRGLGLQDAIIKWLERSQGQNGMIRNTESEY